MKTVLELWPWLLVGLAAIFVFALGQRIVSEWRDGLIEKTNATWEAKVAKQALDQKKLHDAIVNTVDERVSARLEELEINQQPILNEIRHEIRTVPVYRDAAVSDSMLENLNRLGTRGASRPAGAAEASTPTAPPSR